MSLSLPDKLQSVLTPILTDSEQRQSVVDALVRLQDSQHDTAAIDGAEVDLARESRCGFPEVVFGEGKPSGLIIRILQQQQKAGQRSLVTRVSEAQATDILAAFHSARHNNVARTLSLSVSGSDNDSDGNPAVAVVSAGSCDAAVAQEAMETLRWMNVAAELVEDVGVAGPQRLITHLPLLKSVDAIVCVAGMEAALPSVVGGHVGCPVIGVPTSVGYGASFGGITALLSMLTCCASNVVTVNIDAGFRGGYVAGMIARRHSVDRIRNG